MASLDYALLADFARVDPAGTLTVVGGSWTYMDALALPTQHRFSVAGRIKSGVDEGPVDIRVDYVGPDDSFRLTAEGSLEPEAGARSYANGKVGLFFAIDALVPLPVEGLYQVRISIDDVEARTLKFEVKLASEDG